MPTHRRHSLIEHFKALPDPRVQGRCEHELLDILIIATCTLLCGGTGFDDMAGRCRAARGPHSPTGQHESPQGPNSEWGRSCGDAGQPFPFREPGGLGPVRLCRAGRLLVSHGDLSWALGVECRLRLDTPLPAQLA